MASKLFTFNISLSILNHLGRNLYRSFTTVLGEAISNSWDANAENVWIYLDKEGNNFLIKDDGDGMNNSDFQNKFLKIGYSKRKEGNASPRKARPYIGRKGIGKLALLSCADKITVISKLEDGEYIGGTVDNSGLDRAITEDLEPSEYPLEKPDYDLFGPYIKEHKKGTVIYFKNLKEGMRNSLDFLKKIIALYFRFALIDESFNIFLDGEKITLNDIKELAEKTQFLWKLNTLNDPYIQMLAANVKEEKTLSVDQNIKGFIASVIKPRDLSILSTGERVGIDLFVNGRLRERDILKHIPTARLVEEYLYGQVHIDILNDDKDRFATSREGVIADDEKYAKFLKKLREILTGILNDWDKWRGKYRESGDPDNLRMPIKERRAEELYNETAKEFELENDPGDPNKKKKVDKWIDDFGGDARYNFTSYADCFISENLIRKHIEEDNIPVTDEGTRLINKWKTAEIDNKLEGNISIDIRQNNNDLSYLDMALLAKLIDPQSGAAAGGHNTGLTNDAKQYKPIRDALMHTALLTDQAKTKLTTIRENIKARVKRLLTGDSSAPPE